MRAPLFVLFILYLSLEAMGASDVALLGNLPGNGATGSALSSSVKGVLFTTPNTPVTISAVRLDLRFE